MIRADSNEKKAKFSSAISVQKVQMYKTGLSKCLRDNVRSLRKPNQKGSTGSAKEKKSSKKGGTTKKGGGGGAKTKPMGGEGKAGEGKAEKKSRSSGAGAAAGGKK